MTPSEEMSLLSSLLSNLLLVLCTADMSNIEVDCALLLKTDYRAASVIYEGLACS